MLWASGGDSAPLNAILMCLCITDITILQWVKYKCGSVFYWVIKDLMSNFSSAWSGSTRPLWGLWRCPSRPSSEDLEKGLASIYIHQHPLKVTIMWPTYLGSWPPAPSLSALSEMGTRWAWPWAWCPREQPCWSLLAPFRWSPQSERESRGFSWGRADQMCSSVHGWWLTAHSPFWWANLLNL